MANPKTFKPDYQRGREVAIDECLKLLAKWFWGTDKNARSCADEMRALKKGKP